MNKKLFASKTVLFVFIILFIVAFQKIQLLIEEKDFKNKIT
ncbi:MAG: hypothetical protein E6931_11740 [Clostridium botulinum]|nr:hypothetical protein [Clostridium botulinum]